MYLAGSSMLLLGIKFTQTLSIGNLRSWRRWWMMAIKIFIGDYSELFALAKHINNGALLQKFIESGSKIHGKD